MKRGLQRSPQPRGHSSLIHDRLEAESLKVHPVDEQANRTRPVHTVDHHSALKRTRWHLPPHGRSSRTSCSGTSLRHGRTNPAWLYADGGSRAVTFRESRRVGATDWGEGWGLVFNGTAFQLGKVKIFWRRMVGTAAQQWECA